MAFALTPRQEEVQQFLRGPERHKLLYGGGRSGKSFILVRAIVIRALMAPGSRHVILRFRGNAAWATIGHDTLPKVMKLCFPGVSLRKRIGFYQLPNKSEIWIAGLDDEKRAEKILGAEYATMMFNECSQIPYASVLIAKTRAAQVVEASIGGETFTLPQRLYYDLNPVGAGHWTNVLFGQKLDPGYSKPTPLADPDNYARASINPIDNKQNLTEETLADFENLPERQRKRFYEGLYVDEIEGALWTYDRLEACRIERRELPKITRVIVSVDPSGARGEDDKRSDEIGIIAGGLGVDGRVYILEDGSCRLGPAGWAQRSVELYRKHGADAIIAETNYGGGMVIENIRAADPNIPVHEVHASRGKWVRAEPVSNLYDAKIDRVRHVGRFPDLEDQLVKFSTNGYSGERSPDRADALVWLVTYLALGATNLGMLDFYRQEADAAKNAPAKPAAAPAKVEAVAPAPAPAPTLVTLICPRGTGVVCGISRREYTPNDNGIIHVLAEDAAPLKRAGFIGVTLAE